MRTNKKQLKKLRKNLKRINKNIRRIERDMAAIADRPINLTISGPEPSASGAPNTNLPDPVWRQG